MNNITISNQFYNGTLINTIGTSNLSENQWIPHPKFKGVYLKELLKSSEVENAISYHLVKIQPNCEISDHIHGENLEIHEVIEGSGTFVMDNKVNLYSPGIISIIPKGLVHKVVANEDGLYILAKFIPGLK